MRLLILFLVCLFFHHPGYTQYAYQLFRPGVQYLYEHELPTSDYTSPLLGIRLDGAACQVMYASIQPDIPGGDPTCLTKVPAFIGSEICQSSAQTSLNLGTDEDPLWLQLFPGALPGTSWLANVQGNDSIYAKVEDLEWRSVLGLMDSVKSIGFYTKDDAAQFVPLYEETPIKISRNYGLVQGVFLHWLGTAAGSIDLIGMSNPQVGLQHPDRQSIFQLQPGDELHLLTVKTTLTDNSFYHEYREKKNILLSTGWLSGNTILFHAFRSDQKIYQSGPAAQPDTLFLSGTADTLFLPWTSLNYLNEQPGALVADAILNDTWRIVTLGNHYFCERPAKRLGSPFFLGNENCAIPWLDALPGDDFYALLGGPYYQNTSIGGFDFRIFNYAHLAGAAPCGTPYDFVVATSSAAAISPLRIWPNPVQDLLYLQGFSASQQYRAEIWNAQGQLIQPITKNYHPHQISVQHLPAGTYYLRCFPTDHPPQTIKFIKL